MNNHTRQVSWDHHRSGAHSWVSVARLAGYVLLSGVIERRRGRKAPAARVSRAHHHLVPAGLAVSVVSAASASLSPHFDKNGDKRLDTAERKAAARGWRRIQAARGFGRRGGRAAAAAEPPGTPGPQASRSPTSSRIPNAPLYDIADAAHDVPAIRERRLGEGAAGVQQHRRRSAGDADRSTARSTRTSACTSAARRPT